MGTTVEVGVTSELIPPHRYQEGNLHLCRVRVPLEGGGDAVCMKTRDHVRHLDEDNSTEGVLQEVFQETLKLARLKDQTYAQAWRTQGYMGNVARVLSKAARLKELLWRDHDNARTLPINASEEELVDIINIAAFALHNLRQGNRWG